MTTPEAKAREKIDCQLNEAGWIVQNRDEIIEDLQSALEELQAISDDLAQIPGAQGNDQHE